MTTPIPLQPADDSVYTLLHTRKGEEVHFIAPGGFLRFPAHPGDPERTRWAVAHLNVPPGWQVRTGRSGDAEDGWKNARVLPPFPERLGVGARVAADLSSAYMVREGAVFYFKKGNLRSAPLDASGQFFDEAEDDLYPTEQLSEASIQEIRAALGDERVGVQFAPDGFADLVKNTQTFIVREGGVYLVPPYSTALHRTVVHPTSGSVLHTEVANEAEAALMMGPLSGSFEPDRVVQPKEEPVRKGEIFEGQAGFMRGAFRTLPTLSNDPNPYALPGEEPASEKTSPVF